MVTLDKVEIPGFREAVRRERNVRDTAFLDGTELVASVEVLPLTLRRLVLLEQSHNGLIAPWRFESHSELLGHAAQLLYVCSVGYRAPKSPRFSFWRTFLESVKMRAFIVGLLRRHKSEEIIDLVESWIKDAMMDAPKGGGSSEIESPSYASYPAHIIDKLAEAGFRFSYDEIMDMPLSRLWQFHRLALHRVNDFPLTNPSDDVATEFLAAQGKEGAA